jgi:DNA replication and repair protein RecF
VRVSWLEARDFRNHSELSLEIPAGLTAVVGPNGRGKTNLLEAVFYLCALESPRVSVDLPLVRMGAPAAFLRGEVESLGGRALIEVEIRASGANRVQVNRSAVRRRRDLRRHVRAVFSGPDDLSVVQGDPSARRGFMDEAVRALWPAKEGTAGAYDRVLRQRNRLLKEWDTGDAPAGLSAWDAELVAHGAALTRARAQAVEAIGSRAGEEFQSLSGGGDEALAVTYQPSVVPEEKDERPQQEVMLEGGDAASGGALEEAFHRRLRERREDELIRRTTLVGPHRDDLGLVVEGLAARGFASHGEAWGAAISLRLALARAVANEAGEEPVLLLDDPFSALDPARRRRLASGLDGRGQTLLAVPDEAQIPTGATVWCAEEGGIVTG